MSWLIGSSYRRRPPSRRLRGIPLRGCRQRECVPAISGKPTIEDKSNKYWDQLSYDQNINPVEMRRDHVGSPIYFEYYLGYCIFLHWMFRSNLGNNWLAIDNSNLRFHNAILFRFSLLRLNYFEKYFAGWPHLCGGPGLLATGWFWTSKHRTGLNRASGPSGRGTKASIDRELLRPSKKNCDAFYLE